MTTENQTPDGSRTLSPIEQALEPYMNTVALYLMDVAVDDDNVLSDMVHTVRTIPGIDKIIIENICKALDGSSGNAGLEGLVDPDQVVDEVDDEHWDAIRSIIEGDQVI